MSEDAGMSTEPDFDAYYSGRELACALKITDVWEYENRERVRQVERTVHGFRCSTIMALSEA